MINWSEVAPALKTLLSGLAVDPGTSFCGEWFEGSRSHINTEVQKELTLKVTSVSEIGDDERRYEDVTVGGSDYVQESIVGHRKFVLQVRVDSYVHLPDDNRWCWSMIERIRTRLKRSSSIAALEAVNVALVSTGQAVDASFIFDKHVVNSALCDLTFYAAFCDTDPVPQGWIERVELTSQVSDIDGDQLPSPLNYVDALIPPAS